VIVQHAGPPVGAGVVHQAVEALAVLAEQRVDHFSDLAGLGHVHLDGHCGAAALGYQLRRLTCRVGTDVPGDDARAAAGKPETGRPAQAAATAGDERSAPGETPYPTAAVVDTAHRPASADSRSRRTNLLNRLSAPSLVSS
jgi:hypothetical protein